MGSYSNLPPDLHRLVSDDRSWALDCAASGARDRLWRKPYELLVYHDGRWELRRWETIAHGKAEGRSQEETIHRGRAAVLRVLAAFEAIDRDAGEGKDDQ